MGYNSAIPNPIFAKLGGCGEKRQLKTLFEFGISNSCVAILPLPEVLNHKNHEMVNFIGKFMKVHSS